MNKIKMVYIVTLIIIITIALQQFTTVNFNTVLKKKAYEDYPFLKDGVTSAHYAIEPITDVFPPSVTYLPEANCFLVEATEYFQKLNSTGDGVFKLNRTEDMELPAFSGYVFCRDGVYDLVVDLPDKVLYTQVHNQDRLLSKDAWKILMHDLYGKAEVVVYGQELPYKADQGFKVYFKIDEEWQVLYTPAHTTRATSDLHALEHFLPGYPARFSATVLLKDEKKKIYSNRQKEEYRLPDSDQEPYQQVYQQQGKIRLLHYEKVMADDHIAYTRFPISFTGMAYYKMQLDNDELFFKEPAIKPSFKKVGRHFNWFVLPAAYAGQSKVSFLEVTYPHNINASGSNGLYIIRPRT